MILVDTSAWVEFDRATGSQVDDMLTELVDSGGTEIDCMIASITIRTGSRLLTADRDFAAMATIVPLRLAL